MIEIKTRFGRMYPHNGKYITHRNKHHFMKKHTGFGLSTTELKTLYEHGIKMIIIKYHKEEKTVMIYKAPLYDWLTSNKTHNNNGDEQKFISIHDMEAVGIEAK